MKKTVLLVIQIILKIILLIFIALLGLSFLVSSSLSATMSWGRPEIIGSIGSGLVILGIYLIIRYIENKK